MIFSIDVIIPTYKRSPNVPGLVSALLPLCSSGDTITIVEQGARPSSVKNNSIVKVIRLPRPNLPAARNTGIKASVADIVLFLDDDIEPLPGLVEAHRGCYSDSSIAGVAGYVNDPFFDPAQTRPSSIDLSNGECLQNFSLPASQKTVSAMGANMSFRRTALLEAGGFDEHYLHNALWEEIDCCLRLQARGHALRYCAGAKVRHLRVSSGGCRQEQGHRYLYHQFANTAYFAARFAEPQHYGSWIRFWKYRLEYLSRRPLAPGRHDPAAVIAGIFGALGGIARYIRSRISSGPAYCPIDKNAVAAAVNRIQQAGVA
jgi:GT2 family glycosyltransferase